MDSVLSPTSVVSLVPHGLPLAMDRERSRVLVAESLHRAAAAANSGSLDAACTLLADAQSMLATSPSMAQRDPLCARLQEVLRAALRRLEETLGECTHRSGTHRSGTSILDKPSLPQLGVAMRAEVGHRAAPAASRPALPSRAEPASLRPPTSRPPPHGRRRNRRR